MRKRGNQGEIAETRLVWSNTRQVTEHEKAKWEKAQRDYLEWRVRKRNRAGWIAGLIVFGLLTMFFVIGQCHFWPHH
jgi:hypothetical protein